LHTISRMKGLEKYVVLFSVETAAAGMVVGLHTISRMKGLEKYVVLFSVETAAVGMVVDLHMMSRFAFLPKWISQLFGYLFIVFDVLILWFSYVGPVIEFNKSFSDRKIPTPDGVLAVLAGKMTSSMGLRGKRGRELTLRTHPPPTQMGEVMIGIVVQETTIGAMTVGLQATLKEGTAGMTLRMAE
jgi:hypothetical protein